MEDAVATLRKIPTCHPDQPYAARNLCRNCYKDKRLEHGGPLRRYNVMPDDLTSSMIPERVSSTQHAVTSFPLPACPKCRRTNTLVYE